MSKLISFEGVDGVGKSTVIQKTATDLTSLGYSVIVLREPGTTNLGLKLRELIKSDTPRSELAEVLLFMASRADMVTNVVTRALKAYDIVLLDRYIDSTIAYQGYGNGVDINLLNELNRMVINNKLPDKTIYIEAPMDVVAERIRLRGDDPDKFDTDKQFAKRVYDGYQEILKSEPDRFGKVVNDDLEDCVQECVTIIQNELNRKTEHKRESLKKLVNKTETGTYRALVSRTGKTDDGKPTLLLTAVKRKGGRLVLTDHVWVDYTRELVSLGTLVPGDLIEFTADVTTYSHENKFGGTYDEYGFTNLTNVTLVKGKRILKNEDDFERKDLSYISTIQDDDLFNRTLVKYLGYVTVMTKKHLV